MDSRVAIRITADSREAMLGLSAIRAFMGPETRALIAAAIDRARARHQKRMRKPLLSGRYGKRRRQRAQGVARMRHMKREHSRRWLAMVKAATYAR